MTRHLFRVIAEGLASIAFVGIAGSAAAQDRAPAEKVGTPASSSIKSTGAASSSYAACVAGQPIGGIVVKGGTNKRSSAEACTAPAGPDTNGPKPVAAEASINSVNSMPSRRSTPPTTVEAPAPTTPPTTDKSISDKGVSATKGH